MLTLRMIENVDESALGMLRNFGFEAERLATEVAIRLASRGDAKGEKLWLAIAERIPHIRFQRD